MATIDLGKIKQVWRGTYNNSTAYVVDDLVEYTDSGITSTYICVANSTGNAPSSSGTAHASWNYVAKGVADPIPSQSGNADKFLKTNGSALSFAPAGGVLQAKQWVKNSVLHDESTSDLVMGSPFDGTATITPTAASNFIKVTYFNTMDHGSTWRSNKFVLQWSSDGGSTYYGIAGIAITVGGQSENMYGNNGSVSVLFHPNTTNAVKVRVVTNGHNAGQGKRMGQYNNEGSDGASYTMDAFNGVTASGHGILLEEYSSDVTSITTIA